MADNLTTTTTVSTVPSGTVIGTDEVTIGAVLQHVQRVKLVDGTDGGTGLIGGDATNGLDVDVTRVTGTVTVDSELPAAAALADATANPTAPATGTFPHGYNGSTWDRLRSTTTNGLVVDVSRIQDTSAGPTAITTQNLNPNSGAATANSTVSLTLAGGGTVSIQVTGTYTGALTPQITVDGTNWIALGSTSLINVNTGAYSATIASAAVGIWKAEITSCAQFRISANAAVTGTATVTIRAGQGTGLVALDNPLPAGTAVIGALTANQSVNVAQINGVTTTMGNGTSGTGVQRMTLASDSTGNIATIGTSVTPGTAAGNLGKAEDAVAASGDTGVAVWAIRRDTAATNVNAAGDYAEIAVSGIGSLWTTPTPNTQGGLSIFHLISAATTNLTNIKASAGQVYGWYIQNTNAAARYVKFHNNASTPTAGAGVIFTIGIPANAAANVEFTMGIPFATGIAISTVTGIADADTAAVAANDLNINIFYK